MAILTMQPGFPTIKMTSLLATSYNDKQFSMQWPSLNVEWEYVQASSKFATLVLNSIVDSACLSVHRHILELYVLKSLVGIFMWYNH